MKKSILILLLLPMMLSAQNYTYMTKSKAKKHFYKEANDLQNWVFQDSIIELLCCRYETRNNDPITDTMQVWTAIYNVDTIEYYFTNMHFPICDSISMKIECDSCANNHLNAILFYGGYRWVQINDSVYMAKFSQFGVQNEKYVQVLVYSPPTVHQYNTHITIYLKLISREELKKLKKMKKLKRN